MMQNFAQRLPSNGSLGDELGSILDPARSSESQKLLNSLWRTEAFLSYKLSQLSESSQEAQHVREEALALKKKITKYAQVVSEERYKLGLMTKMLESGLSERQFNRSFKEKSFREEIEQIIEKRFGKEAVSVLIPNQSVDLQNNKQSGLENILGELKTPSVVDLPKVKSHKNLNCNGKKPDSGVSRTQLPFLTRPNPTLNVWSFLRHNIGKDLSRITMPIAFNEPITMLQRSAQFLEFEQVLRRANQETDEGLRSALILAAFSGTIGANSKRLRKPFNPLLGETYEYCKGDLKFISEQICHHPPISGFYAECNDFIVEGALHVYMNISLTGFAIEPRGQLRVTLKRDNKRFIVQQPVSSLHNYIIGEMYLWFKGTLAVDEDPPSVSEPSDKALYTGARATLEYLPRGWIGHTDYCVKGTVSDSHNSKSLQLEGEWTKFLNIIKSDGSKDSLMETFPEIDKANQQYHFTKFSVTLNEVNDEIKSRLPPTDSRLRRDLRLFEEGKNSEAEVEKSKLEDAQRDRKKKSQSIQPRWFTYEEYPNGQVRAFYRKDNDYFRIRAKGTWPSDIQNLFN